MRDFTADIITHALKHLGIAHVRVTRAADRPVLISTSDLSGNLITIAVQLDGSIRHINT